MKSTVAVPLRTLAQIKTSVDQRLMQVYATRLTPAATIDPLYSALIQDLGNFIARGGKRLRPYLTYLSYQGFGGENEAGILDVAVSQELLHSFMLMHDDVIDRDTMRYGGPNIAGLYQMRFEKDGSANAAHMGASTAILGGDINYSLAHQTVLACSFSAAQKLKTLARLEQMVMEVVGGELVDMALPELDPREASEDRLLRVMRYKTASYTFEAPLQIGAMLAGASVAEQKKLSACAIPAGIAFQLQDDLLGMFGDETLTGKPAISDLREGKRTLLIHFGLSLSGKHDADTIAKCLGNPNVTQAEHAAVKQILIECGAEAKTKTLALQYGEQARGALHRTKLSATAAGVLMQLSSRLDERKA